MDYPGYFPVGDTEALQRSLIRAEEHPSFVTELERHVCALAPRLSIDEEQRRWAALIAGVQTESAAP